MRRNGHVTAMKVLVGQKEVVMDIFLRDLLVGVRGKNDGERKYRLISSNYWRWHIKWNIVMAALLSVPTIGFILQEPSDKLRTALIVVGFLCVFAVMAKMTYDTDRWDRCIACGSQYIGEEKHCSGCGIAREGNTEDGITRRLRLEKKAN